MWVRTTLTTERWTKEKAKDNTSAWDENSTGAKAIGLSLWQ
uniref:Protein interacting with cyclin A1 n=1 Tax=Panthera tigris altaica TaxID=74533 RepID=A0A8C9MCA8_PANTA